MRASFWNQEWKHKEVVNLPPSLVYEKLLKHYTKSGKSFVLESEKLNKYFSFSRGKVLMSVLGFGSELWLKHFSKVELKELGGSTEIEWSISLKILGFQVGTNAIIEECKEVVKNIA